MNPKSFSSRQIQSPTTIFIQSRKPSNTISLPGSIQSIKLSQVLPYKQISQKKSLPIKEFEYTEVNNKIKRRTYSQLRSKTSSRLNTINENLKLDRMPIKIIKDKILFEENTRLNLKRGATSRKIRIDRESEPNQNPQSQSEESQSRFLMGNTSQKLAKTTARQAYEERVNSFSPKPSIFKRYHYENYENYSYKNPFKKNRYEQMVKDDKVNQKYEFPKNNKYQLNKGSAKNLEIVFCETKYPDFVKKTNEIFEKKLLSPTRSDKNTGISGQNSSIFQGSESKVTDETSLKVLKQNVIEEMGVRSRDLLNSKNTRRWAYSPQRIKSSMERGSGSRKRVMVEKGGNSKSTLQRHLQEFKILQKLTLLNEKQQENKLKRKNQSPQICQDMSKTVFVSLVIYKFSFLQRLSRSFRNHLLKILFGLDSMGEEVKIGIHEYLKFNRIFITRDSPLEQISEFIYQLLFRTRACPSLQGAKKVLDQINVGKRQKMEVAVSRLFEMINQKDVRREEVMEKICLDPEWIASIIQLIKDQ